MTNLKSETNEKTSLLSAKLEVEGHILRVNHAMRTVQRKRDLVIDGVIHTQKGVLQPQIASPVTLMEGLIKCPCLSKRYLLAYPIEQGLGAPVRQII